MNRPDFTVADLGELMTLYVAKLTDGCEVWVVADLAYWTLVKGLGGSTSPTILAPLPGAPIAGEPNARWARNVGGGGSTTPIVIERFTANFSTLDRVAQFVAPGNCVITTLTPVRPYVIIPVDTLASTFVASYQGDTNNTNGQTVEFAPQFSIDNGSTWNDISGMRLLLQPTNNTGFHGAQATVAPQLLPAHCWLSLVLTPSAALDADLKNLSFELTT